MRTVSFIGCGAAGQAIARLFHESGGFRVGAILNRSLASGSAAAEFIGAGGAVTDVASLGGADLFVIAASDDSIPGCAETLAASGQVGEGTVVCHLSGALSSGVLAPLRDVGATVASVHPVKSFADRSAAVTGFAGTWCGIEGDETAVALLSEAFGAIGGRVFSVDPRFKTVYHAGAVLACNYLTALMELSISAYGKAAVPREVALQVMEPLVRGTVDNIFKVGTEQALSGPIARGEISVVGRQVAALKEWDADVTLLYRTLGRVAVDLSRRAGNASEVNLQQIEEVLANP